MTDGIFVSGQRPKFKKDVLKAIQEAPHSVSIEVTSMFSADCGRRIPIPNLVVNRRYNYTGPDVHKDRQFYGSIMRTDTGYIAK